MLPSFGAAAPRVAQLQAWTAVAAHKTVPQPLIAGAATRLSPPLPIPAGYLALVKMHLIDLYNFKPPAELIVHREEAQALRVQAAKTSLVSHMVYCHSCWFMSSGQAGFERVCSKCCTHQSAHPLPNPWACDVQPLAAAAEMHTAPWLVNRQGGRSPCCAVARTHPAGVSAQCLQH